MLIESIINDKDDKDIDDELADINALANKILAANDNEENYDEIDYDEDDDEEEDNEDDEEDEEETSVDLLNNDINSKTKDENADIYINQINDKDTINKAIEILNKKKKIDVEKVKEPFGKYEIIYSDGSNNIEKYTKLIENEKINKVEHEPATTTINKIKSSIDRFPEERSQIQQFLTSNDKEAKVSEIRGLIEASLFVLGSEGLNSYDLKKVTGLPLSIINNILEEMVYYYQKNKDSGLKIAQYGNRYKFVTKPQYTENIGLVLNKKERKPISDSVLETLAIIAYNQPCTKGTIEKIRNKSSINAIERLKELGLIEADERSEAIGKPWLYSVTQKFFDMYGIKSLSELPILNRDSKNYNDEVDSDANFIDEINEE